MILSMAANPSTIPSLPSSLSQVYSSCSGQRLRESSESPFPSLLFGLNATPTQNPHHLHAAGPFDHPHLRRGEHRALRPVYDVARWHRSCYRTSFLVRVTFTYVDTERLVAVGKFGLVSSVFALPTPFRTRGDCMDWLGRLVIPSRRQSHALTGEPCMDRAYARAPLSPR
jgi:hypothetical protein